MQYWTVVWKARVFIQNNCNLDVLSYAWLHSVHIPQVNHNVYENTRPHFPPPAHGHSDRIETTNTKWAITPNLQARCMQHELAHWQLLSVLHFTPPLLTTVWHNSKKEYHWVWGVWVCTEILHAEGPCSVCSCRLKCSKNTGYLVHAGYDGDCLAYWILGRLI